MTSDPATPADRAAAVLRAAEAASAARREPPAPVPAAANAAPGTGAADRLLLAADVLAAGVEDARGRLHALDQALERLTR